MIMSICLRGFCAAYLLELSLRGGSQVLSLPKMIFNITIDHVTTLVSETFEGIFGPLTHIGTCVDLDRLLGSKTQILK